ncbi:hypothetical protein ABOM_003425 [Aspergillus bombycis]|uniref:Uncharacterized protein n=1 Tax=Aspergillus bombycis TaxID=109264 RepID=A0A1F8A9F3_9EURO|nr:hypothetical protein ABOM_003425 [Aspergillus bombycis]OGM48362.1 hypothetical protein ABOM_003425 [Aspergillus bombycis]
MAGRLPRGNVPTSYNSNMQIKSIFVVLTGLMAFAAAAPAEPEARDTAGVKPESPGPRKVAARQTGPVVATHSASVKV